MKGSVHEKALEQPQERMHEEHKMNTRTLSSYFKRVPKKILKKKPRQTSRVNKRDNRRKRPRCSAKKTPQPPVTVPVTAPQMSPDDPADGPDPFLEFDLSSPTPFHQRGRRGECSLRDESFDFSTRECDHTAQPRIQHSQHDFRRNSGSQEAGRVPSHTGRSMLMDISVQVLSTVVDRHGHGHLNVSTAAVNLSTEDRHINTSGILLTQCANLNASRNLNNCSLNVSSNLDLSLDFRSPKARKPTSFEPDLDFRSPKRPQTMPSDLDTSDLDFRSPPKPAQPTSRVDTTELDLDFNSPKRYRAPAPRGASRVDTSEVDLDFRSPKDRVPAPIRGRDQPSRMDTSELDLDFGSPHPAPAPRTRVDCFLDTLDTSDLDFRSPNCEPDPVPARTSRVDTSELDLDFASPAMALRNRGGAVVRTSVHISVGEPVTGVKRSSGEVSPVFAKPKPKVRRCSRFGRRRQSEASQHSAATVEIGTPGSLNSLNDSLGNDDYQPLTQKEVSQQLCSLAEALKYTPRTQRSHRIRALEVASPFQVKMYETPSRHDTPDCTPHHTPLEERIPLALCTQQLAPPLSVSSEPSSQAHYNMFTHIMKSVQKSLRRTKSTAAPLISHTVNATDTTRATLCMDDDDDYEGHGGLAGAMPSADVDTDTDTDTLLEPGYPRQRRRRRPPPNTVRSTVSSCAPSVAPSPLKRVPTGGWRGSFSQ